MGRSIEGFSKLMACARRIPTVRKVAGMYLIQHASVSVGVRKRFRMHTGLARSKVVECRRRVGRPRTGRRQLLPRSPMHWRLEGGSAAMRRVVGFYMARKRTPVCGWRRDTRRAGAAWVKRFAKFARLLLGCFSCEDCDWLGENRWNMRHMVGVAEQQLQRMLPGRQGDRRLRLARAEM